MQNIACPLQLLAEGTFGLHHLELTTASRDTDTRTTADCIADDAWSTATPNGTHANNHHSDIEIARIISKGLRRL